MMSHSTGPKAPSICYPLHRAYHLFCTPPGGRKKKRKEVHGTPIPLQTWLESCTSLEVFFLEEELWGDNSLFHVLIRKPKYFKQNVANWIPWVFLYLCLRYSIKKRNITIKKGKHGASEQFLRFQINFCKSN